MPDKNRKLRSHIRSFVYANKSLVQNFPAGLLTTVQYDNVVYDLLDEYNIAGAWQFIPRRAGIYLITATLSIAAVGALRINLFHIYLNAASVTIQRKEISVANDETYQTRAVTYITPNDNITVRFQADPAAAFVNLIAGAECTLSICRLD